MPLPKPKSPRSEAFKNGVRELIRSGRKPKQSVAIMYAQVRRGKGK